MKLFHASRVVHDVGTKLLSKGVDTAFFRRACDAGKGGVEEVLATRRPDGAPGRRSCLYACGTVEHCQIYAEGEPHDGEWHFYEVSMPQPWRAPMVLAGRLLRVGPDTDIGLSVANEYWSPTAPWRYFEYMDVEMEILAVVEPTSFWPPPTPVDAARADFLGDAALAGRLFPH